MNRIFLFLFIVISTISANAQEGSAPGNGEFPDPALPTVLPGSPEASAINKGASISTGLFSGVARATIPFYDLKVKNFSLPIGLNYASGGMKLNDIPSRQGMGWTLSCAGVVTRIIHGLPDEKTTRAQPPANFLSIDQANFDYLFTCSSTAPAYETQPDEFRFDAPGLSGKFIVKDDGSILQIPYSNLKIQVLGSGVQGPLEILITNTAGIKYRFGGNEALEYTLTQSNFRGIPANQVLRTGYFLKQIVMPDGQTITYNYSPINFSTITGIIHTYTRAVVNPASTPSCPTSPAVKCPDPSGNTGTFKELFNSVNYHSVYLTSITTNDFRSISFGYQSRPDGAGDNRLTYVSISAGLFSKNYSLQYLDPNETVYPGAGNVGSYNWRFFLTAVNLSRMTPNGIENESIQLEYIEPEGIPQRLCYGEDEFGYANGKGNSTLLPAGADGVTNSYVSADRSPDFNYARKGLLKKITYPTGGYQEFFYEPNTSIYGPQPGARVQKIETHDPVSNQSTFKYYKYAFLDNLNLSSGQPILTASYLSTIELKKFCNSCMGCYIVCMSRVISSNSSISSYLLEGNETGYAAVIESDDLTFSNGGIEHVFEYMPSTNHNVVLGEAVPGLGFSCITNLNGYETETKYFNNNLSLVRKTVNHYSLDNSINSQYSAIAVRRRYEPSQQIPVGGDMFDVFDAVRYTYVSSWIKLLSTDNYEYDAAGNTSQNTVSYIYGSSANTLPLRVETLNSKNELVGTETKYPTDFSSTAPYDVMASMNIISPPVEIKQTNGNNNVAVLKNNYTQWHSGINTAVIEPSTISLKLGMNPEETRIRYYSYDSKGNPLELSKEDNVHLNYIWDYQSQYPVAEIQNVVGGSDIFAYSSFEGENKGNWSYAGSPVSEFYQPTGVLCYNLNAGAVSSSASAAENYIITCWLKSGSGSVSANGNFGTALFTRRGWICLKFNIQGASSISVSGTGIIDELRLYPKKAQITSYSYRPHIGIISRCDVNNNIMNYEYDDLARLVLVRDKDGNVLNKYCYTLAGKQENCGTCTDGTPNWQNTSTPAWCEQGNCGNTGYKFQEMIDLNPCSNSYNQIDTFRVYDPTFCVPNATGIAISYYNYINDSGFTATYTNSSTGAIYQFPVPIGTGTLGCVPAGNYTVTINKQGNANTYLFSLVCRMATGTSATFSKIAVSSTSCNICTIDFEY